MLVTTAQIHSTESQLRLGAVSNPARGVTRFVMVKISKKQFKGPTHRDHHHYYKMPNPL